VLKDKLDVSNPNLPDYNLSKYPDRKYFKSLLIDTNVHVYCIV